MEDKEWVLLFQINDRSWLQDELNRAVRDYDIRDIQVWSDEQGWKAMVRYHGNPPQLLLKQET